MTKENNSTFNDMKAPDFSLGKVYLKDISLETPNSPNAFFLEVEPSPAISIEFTVKSTPLLNVDNASIPNDAYEASLILSITSIYDEKTMFLVEIEQAGLFIIRNTYTKAQLNRFLNVRCPKILYPYAREAIDNILTKAGFAPLMIGPLNFKGVYDKSLASAKQQTK